MPYRAVLRKTTSSTTLELLYNVLQRCHESIDYMHKHSAGFDRQTQHNICSRPVSCCLDLKCNNCDRFTLRDRQVTGRVTHQLRWFTERPTIPRIHNSHTVHKTKLTHAGHWRYETLALISTELTTSSTHKVVNNVEYILACSERVLFQASDDNDIRMIRILVWHCHLHVVILTNLWHHCAATPNDLWVKLWVDWNL